MQYVRSERLRQLVSLSLCVPTIRREQREDQLVCFTNNITELGYWMKKEEEREEEGKLRGYIIRKDMDHPLSHRSGHLTKEQLYSFVRLSPYFVVRVATFSSLTIDLHRAGSPCAS